MAELKLLRIPNINLKQNSQEIIASLTEKNDALVEENKYLCEKVHKLTKEVEILNSNNKNIQATADVLTEIDDNKDDIITDLVQRIHELERETQELRMIILIKDKKTQLAIILSDMANLQF